MIISSELTGKTYKTVEECLAAEASYKEEEEKKRKAAQLRAHELDKAQEEAIAACDRYLKMTGIDYEILDEAPWATFRVKSEPKPEPKSESFEMKIEPIDISIIKELLGI